MGKKITEYLYMSVNLLLFFAGAATLANGTWTAFTGEIDIAITSLTAGLILLFASTIDRFESLKGLGVEAKTRQLDQKLDQADEALFKVKEMTELTGRSLIQINSKIGRLDSAPTITESIVLADEIRTIMAGVGSSDDVIHDVLRPWAKTLCMDITFSLIKPLRILLQEDIRQLTEERNGLGRPVDVNDERYIEIQKQLQLINDFLSGPLREVHLIEIDDYPEQCMALFDDAPCLDMLKIKELRENAAKFIPGMLSLKKDMTLIDVPLWEAELNRE